MHSSQVMIQTYNVTHTRHHIGRSKTDLHSVLVSLSEKDSTKGNVKICSYLRPNHNSNKHRIKRLQTFTVDRHGSIQLKIGNRKKITTVISTSSIATHHTSNHIYLLANKGSIFYYPPPYQSIEASHFTHMQTLSHELNVAPTGQGFMPSIIK